MSLTQLNCKYFASSRACTYVGCAHCHNITVTLGRCISFLPCIPLSPAHLSCHAWIFLHRRTASLLLHSSASCEPAQTRCLSLTDLSDRRMAVAGDPLTDPDIDSRGAVEFWHSHAIISDEARTDLLACNFSGVGPLGAAPIKPNATVVSPVGGMISGCLWVAREDKRCDPAASASVHDV